MECESFDRNDEGFGGEFSEWVVKALINERGAHY
jgi:hypothetical protein